MEAIRVYRLVYEDYKQILNARSQAKRNSLKDEFFNDFEKTDMNQGIVFIGTGSGWGARNMGTGKGPQVLLNSTEPNSHSERIFSSLSIHSPILQNFHNFDSFTPFFPLTSDGKQIRQQHVLKALKFHFDALDELFKQSLTPFCIGGDHSLAIATWSAAKLHYDDFGLIWIDAHLDAHIYETSPSQAIHGMPIATLLGFGDPALRSFTDKARNIHPKNLVYIGARSFEVGERALLNRLGVKIYYMEEVKTRGFAEVFQEAKQYVTRNTPYYGISLDIDAFDPTHVSGTGTKEPDGLTQEDTFPSLTNLLNDPHLICLELVEFNPDLDVKDQTLTFLWHLTKTLLGDLNDDNN